MAVVLFAVLPLGWELASRPRALPGGARPKRLLRLHTRLLLRACAFHVALLAAVLLVAPRGAGFIITGHPGVTVTMEPARPRPAPPSSEPVPPPEPVPEPVQVVEHKPLPPEEPSKPARPGPRAEVRGRFPVELDNPQELRTRVRIVNASDGSFEECPSEYAGTRFACTVLGRGAWRVEVFAGQSSETAEALVAQLDVTGT